jgi:hypothetical protein
LVESLLCAQKEESSIVRDAIANLTQQWMPPFGKGARLGPVSSHLQSLKIVETITKDVLFNIPDQHSKRWRCSGMDRLVSCHLLALSSDTSFGPVKLTGKIKLSLQLSMKKVMLPHNE